MYDHLNATNQEFLEMLKYTRMRLIELDHELEFLQSEDNRKIVIESNLKDMEKFVLALKEAYSNYLEIGLQAINHVADNTERDILLHTYFKGMKHAETWRTLEIPKQTYWVKHNKAIEHFAKPKLHGNVPVFPNEDDFT